VAGFCDHGNEPSGSIKKADYCLTSRVTISFSNNTLHHRVSKFHHKPLIQGKKGQRGGGREFYGKWSFLLSSVALQYELPETIVAFWSSWARIFTF
jgi:hypothetical protein